MSFVRNICKLPHCDACGEVRVIHPLEKLLSYIEEHTEHKSERTTPPSKIHANRKYAFFRLLSKVGIVTFSETPGYTNDSRVHALFEGARARNLRLLACTIGGHHLTFFLIDTRERVLSFSSLPHELLPYHSPLWIDDKYVLANFLLKHNLTAPASHLVTERMSLAEIPEPTAQNTFIIKPCIGTRGRHSTLHIDSREKLKTALRRGFQISTRLVLQKELHGTVYRITVVGGSQVFVAKREYPFVVGDGIHTISELVDIENTASYRDDVYFRKLPFGEHEKNFLISTGMHAEDVLEPGIRCVVSDKNSRRNGTVVEDVTDETHDSIKEYVRRAAQLLASPIVGFDVIIENHQLSMTEQSVGIIECNSVPYLDVHHKVVSGLPRNVAAELFSLVIGEYSLRT